MLLNAARHWELLLLTGQHIQQQLKRVGAALRCIQKKIDLSAYMHLYTKIEKELSGVGSSMSPGKRVLYIWMPRLPVNRFGRNGLPVEDSIFSVTSEKKNTVQLSCVNALAQKAGLAPGMTLTSACAISPTLVSVCEEPARDAVFLKALQRWCEKYTPWSACDGKDALVLNITGCAHLFGGETMMATMIFQELADMRIEARIGVADTKGAAMAAARFGPQDKTIIETGKTRTQLKDFPIEALCVESQILFELKRLGLKYIGDLYPLKSADLARRFSLGLVNAYEKLLGVAADPVTSTKALPVFAARISFPDPIGLRDDINEALLRLCTQLCKRLSNHSFGIRELRLSFYRADKTDTHIDIGLARPTQEVSPILRQFELKLGNLDAGAGIDMMRIYALNVEPFKPAQRGFAPAEKQDELDELISTLGNRLGFDRILRWRPRASHSPRRSFYLTEATSRKETGGWSVNLARPLMLLDDEPITVITPGRPPKRFEWRRKTYTTARAQGPERIGPEWWRGSTGGVLRDYWRIDSVEGPRFWLSTRPGKKPKTWETSGLFP